MPAAEDHGEQVALFLGQRGQAVHDLLDVGVQVVPARIAPGIMPDGTRGPQPGQLRPDHRAGPGMADRFATALDCADTGFLPDGVLDELPSPAQVRD